MCAALGGRASEQLNFGKISTGALNDLEKVTKQAYAMVSYFGMSDKIGNISFYDSQGRNEYSFSKPYSEKTAELIDAEAKRIVEEQYKRALSVLSENKEGLTILAERLLEKEVIFSDDVEEIFGKYKEEELYVSKNNKKQEESNNEANLSENENVSVVKEENNEEIQETENKSEE